MTRRYHNISKPRVHYTLGEKCIMAVAVMFAVFAVISALMFIPAVFAGVFMAMH